MLNKSRAINYSVPCIPGLYLQAATFYEKKMFSNIIAALLVLTYKSVHTVGGSKILDIIIFAAVDPEVVVELNVRDVVDEIISCFAVSLSYFSDCENVCVFVYTSDELAFEFNRIFMVFENFWSLFMLSASFCMVFKVSSGAPIICMIASVFLKRISKIVHTLSA